MRASKNILVNSAVVFTALATTACQAPSDPSVPSHLSLTNSGSIRTQMNQCLSTSASLVALSDTAVNFSGNATIKGSVVLLGSSTLRLSGNAKISDKLYLANIDQVSASGNASVGQVVVRDLTGNEKNVLNFVDDLGSLAETSTLQRISSSMTLHGNGSLNVIQVNGDLSLAGNQTLTLDGSANDLFLINVGGNVSLSGNSNIVVSGNLPAANVLFRVPTSGANVSLSGNGKVQGTFIAPRGTAQISGNGRIQGSVLAWNSITLSGNGLTFDPVPFCPIVAAPTPTPSPTVTATPSPSSSPSSSPSVTPSTTPSASPTVDPSPTVSPSASPSATPSASPSPEVSPSPSPSTCSGPFCGGMIGV